MTTKTTVTEMRVKGDLVFTYTRLIGNYNEDDVTFTTYEDSVGGR